MFPEEANLRDGDCIISGFPGIRKTTLAQAFVARFLDNGDGLVAGRVSVSDVFEAFNSRRHQVVYFDDFLGQTCLKELARNEVQYARSCVGFGLLWTR